MIFGRSLQVLLTLLDDKKLVKERNDYYLGGYILFTIFFMYVIYFEQAACPKFALKLMMRTGYLKKNDLIVRDIIFNNLYKC